MDSKKSKMGFFKKVKNSITKFEKYPEMAAEGIGSSISYFSKIVALLSIIVAIGLVYQFNELVVTITEYVANDFPDFIYEDGKLKMETDEKIDIQNDMLGLITIDTSEDVNYEELKKSDIVILNDKIIIPNYSSETGGQEEITYKSIEERLGLTENIKFTKQELIEKMAQGNKVQIYISYFIVMFIYAFILYFASILSDVLLLSIFGYITAAFAKLKMRYQAVFSMSIYALTLSIILNMIYILINIFFDFEIKYFQVMYTAIAYICLAAAIFMIKSDFIKSQAELMKVLEEGLEERQQITIERKPKEEEKKEEKEENKKDEKKEENEDKHIGDGDTVS